MWKALVSKDDHACDPLVLVLLALSIGLLFFTGYDIWRGHEFSPLTFGTGGASLLGAYGGGKGAREALTPQDPTNGAQ